MREFDYKLRRSRRSKTMRLSVSSNGSVRVSAPTFLPKFAIERFVDEKKDWIQEKIKYFMRFPQPIRLTKKEQILLYRKNKEEARRVVESLILKFNTCNDFFYNRISIKNHKGRWGSCSAKGNLNFNYRIIFLKQELQEYIIVHELCHLKELNHGKNFWLLVEEYFPNWKNARKELRNQKM